MLIFVGILSCKNEVEIDKPSFAWRIIDIDVQGNLFDIWFVSEDVGYIFGSNDKSFFLKTTDGGETWHDLPSSLSANIIFTSFFPVTDRMLYAARDSVYKSMDGGTTWKRMASNLNGRNIRKLYFTSETDGYALTGNGIYQTTNGGNGWNVVKQANTGYDDCNFLDADYAYFSGGALVEYNADKVASSYGLLTKTTDGGKTWQDLNTGDWLNNTQNLKKSQSISFTDKSHGYLADFDGQLLNTTDGGVTWSVVSTLPSIASQILFADQDTGLMLSGDGIYITTDGGQHFQKQYSASGQLYKIIQQPVSKKMFVIGGNGLFVAGN